jgi:hypothetical protein
MMRIKSCCRDRASRWWRSFQPQRARSFRKERKEDEENEDFETLDSAPLLAVFAIFAVDLRGRSSRTLPLRASRNVTGTNHAAPMTADAEPKELKLLAERREAPAGEAGARG